MAEASQALNGNGFASPDLHVADGVEDGQPSTENGCIARGIDVGRNVDSRLGANESILGIYTRRLDTKDERKKGTGNVHPPSFVAPLTAVLSHIWK